MPAQEQARAVCAAYELIEAAQDHDVSEELAALDAQAREQGWGEVVLLMHFARSLLERDAGRDDSEHVRAMVQTVQELGDPALVALGLATTAMRDATVGANPLEARVGAEPLVRAVILLDSAHSLVVHRVAARLEVAGGFHALGLWPLAHEQLALLEPLFRQAHDPLWDDVLHRQKRVVHANKIDMAVDEACALAEVGKWKAAAHNAVRHLPDVLTPLDDGWAPSWVAMVHAFADIFAALAGRPSPADRRMIAQQAQGQADDPNLAMLAVADAIRAHQAGDAARAARLAGPCAGPVTPNVPMHVRLLALNLAVRDPGTPPAALTYASELVALRWNSRLSRLTSMRAAIDAERRRAEHEFLRDQVLIDELTGLGNRRAYTAYLERIRRTLGPPGSSRRRRSTETELVIMMVDVDHFKQVNDTFGHDVGDQVLRRIGSILTSHVRSDDLAARLGGDEFVVVMCPDVRGIGAARAEAIVKSVREHPWSEVAPGLSISISLGLHRGPAADLSHLTAEADRQLYVAKREGRGRVAGGTP
ncbi:hypothetical protein Kisp01_26450 [Kineosporia sp. NBRC 101677]|uniref:GGDEF domain-containing protein n=1 Tax=Kineosporia sp. NBRC 101677 TaxID=3032197 RepID=UPI0024A464CF|nr:GGDEF domain-containing protein [Kineosporia sp. NBRC 101677]GLY15630.1 hypothetical protein Kisp01_26450 [Kineosporia sp. NBRC 101677]